MEFFTFKKLVGLAFMPLPVAIAALVLGITALLLNRQRLGLLCCTAPTLLLFLASTPFVADPALRSIERQYHQFDMSQPVDYIVILGCGHVNDGQIPISAQIKACSLYRIVEALRIFQQNPKATLITSGNTGAQPFSNAEMNRRLLRELGVADAQIIGVELSKDTEEEARNLARLLGSARFALVTSASHMPRAMGLFEAQGLTPLPAPTEHLVRESQETTLLGYIPSSRHLQKAERWWYETLGATWLWLKDLMS